MKELLEFLDKPFVPNKEKGVQIPDTTEGRAFIQRQKDEFAMLIDGMNKSVEKVRKINQFLFQQLAEFNQEFKK